MHFSLPLSHKQHTHTHTARANECLERDPNGKPLSFAKDGYSGEMGFYFRQGNVYVQIIASDQNPKTIEAAQAAGYVDPSWAPTDLLVLLFGIGLAWAQFPDPHPEAAADPAVVASRRAAAVEAAARIISPPSH